MGKRCERLVRVNEVAALVGLSVSRILDLERRGVFPARVDLGRSVQPSWAESEVIEFARRIEAAFLSRLKRAA